MSDQKAADSSQKVTLYLPAELHRSVKIQAAVECESMSALAKKALQFYLENPELVDGQMGRTHVVHRCPACSSSFVMREGEPELLPGAGVRQVNSMSQQDVERTVSLDGNSQPDLVPC